MFIFVLYIVFDTVIEITRNPFINRCFVVITDNNWIVKIEKDLKIVKIRLNPTKQQRINSHNA